MDMNRRSPAFDGIFIGSRVADFILRQEPDEEGEEGEEEEGDEEEDDETEDGQSEVNGNGYSEQANWGAPNPSSRSILLNSAKESLHLFRLGPNRLVL